MGTRSLEAILRARLLGSVAAALVAVTVASLVVTSQVLAGVERDAARERAAAALHLYQAERAEGDTPRDAAREVVAGAEAEGTLLLLAVDGSSTTPRRSDVPAAIASLEVGTCTVARDAAQRSWHGCAVRHGEAVAVAAVAIDKDRAALRTIAGWMTLMAAITLLGVAGAARLALRSVVASVQALVSWSREVAIVRESPAAPPKGMTTELDQLTVSFDELVRRLLEALARERASSAHIAHELRTPLAALKGELESLRSAAPHEPTRSADAIGRMLGDVDRLAAVVDAILVLSSPPRAVASGQVVNVADLVREVAPPETRVEAPDEALVLADAHLVSLSLKNLLANAERYSGKCATELRVEREGAFVRIDVRDEGPGLAADGRAKMFDRYWRASADGDGSGLGLALVRAVAERHGGSASARENPRGRGLEVSLTLGGLVGWHEG